MPAGIPFFWFLTLTGSAFASMTGEEIYNYNITIFNSILMIDLQLSSSVAFDLLNSKIRRFFAKESNKWKKDGPWRLPSACYTLEHKLAFLEREHYLTGHYSLRGIFHDWEKPFLYLCPLMRDEAEIQTRHRASSPHHDGCVKTSKIEHLIEMYLDWDCAAITKPDKPLNAFETLVHFYPDSINIMLPVCLAIDPDAVKEHIYLHGWHDLSKNPDYNRKIYAKVLYVLKQTINDFSLQKSICEEIVECYKCNHAITNYSPKAIFVIALYKQQKNLNFTCRLSQVKEILEKKLKELEKGDAFIASPAGVIIHDYRQIKSSPYFKR